MLRQWLEVATLAIGQDSLALALPGRAIEMIFPTDGGTNGKGGRVLSMLADFPGHHGIRRVRIVISNQLLRYAVLPWHEGMPALQDWMALAAYEMRRLYGEAADAWDVRVSLQGFGKPAVACGISHELVTEIEEMAERQRWIVVAIEPALMTAFNAVGRDLAGSDGWMMFAEPQRLMLAECADGAWQRFSMSSPLPGGEAEEAVAMLARAVQLGGQGGARTFCFLGPQAWQPDCSRFSGLQQIRPAAFLRLEREHPIGMLAGL